MNVRARRQRLSHIQQIAESLRQSDDAAAPDLTGSILDAVDAERPFLSKKTRRMVIAGRFALGFAVVCVVGGIALAHRSAPSLFEWSSRPAPLSAVVEKIKSEGQVTLAGFQRQVQTMTVSAPGAAPASSQVFVSLSAPAERVVQTLSFNCAMVGPTLPPAEAARRCCTTSREAKEAACCAYRPLAGIARLPGVVMPVQSPWRRSGGLAAPALDAETAGVLGVESPNPLPLDDDLPEIPAAPEVSGPIADNLS